MDAENSIIEQAFAILTSRLHKSTVALSSPQAVEQYLLHKLMLMEREIFGVIWLNVKNRVIACEDLGLGTLTHAPVYPREVVKSALKHNAASAILYHNHPSGDTTPSDADKSLTIELKKILALIDVRVLDHIIVSGTQTLSFAMSGEIF